MQNSYRIYCWNNYLIRAYWDCTIKRLRGIKMKIIINCDKQTGDYILYILKNLEPEDEGSSLVINVNDVSS